MENLRKSELVIARILEKLIEFGIQNSTLEFSELELGEEYFHHFISCSEWLEAEGMIRTTSIVRQLDGGGIVMNPVLTSYGIQKMGAEIEIGDSNITMATAVKKVSQNEDSSYQIGDFFGGILGGFTKSMSQ